MLIRDLQGGSVVPQSEVVAVDGEDAVLQGEGFGGAAESGGGDEGCQVGAEVGFRAEEVTRLPAGNGAGGGVALALDDHCAAVWEAAGDVSAVVSGAAGAADVGAAVVPAESRDQVFEFGAGHLVDVGQCPMADPNRVLPAPAPVSAAKEPVRT